MADPREPAASDEAHRSTGRAAAVGLGTEAAGGTVAAYFSAFRWDATLDPTTMSAAAFLGAVLSPGGRGSRAP